jgi:hypothetical protein
MHFSRNIYKNIVKNQTIRFAGLIFLDFPLRRKFKYKLKKMTKFLLTISVFGIIFAIKAQEIKMALPNKEESNILNIKDLDSIQDFSVGKNLDLSNLNYEMQMMEFHNKNLKINKLADEILKPISIGEWYLQESSFLRKNSPYFVDGQPFSLSYSDDLMTIYSMRMGINRYIYKDLYVGLGLEPSVIYFRQTNKKSFSLRYYGKVGFKF